MSIETDILFVTQLLLPRDTGDLTAYKPLRLELRGQTATFPTLRALASPNPEGAFQQMAQLRQKMGIPPVLTGIYLQDCLSHHGLSLVEIPCLEAGLETVKAAVARGVRLIALSTTWLPGSRGATYVRQAVQQLRLLAPGIPIVVGGVGVRKGLRARTLLQQNKIGGISEAELAEHFLFIDAAQDAGIDAMITSEGGENTLAAIARCLRDGKDFRGLPNLAFPAASGYRFTETAPETSDIDGGIVDWSKQTQRLAFFEAPVRTAMGCPFRCEFCDFMGLYEPRLRSVESLIAELRTLAGALPAPRRVFFTDDNLAVTRNRLVQFTSALCKEKLGLTWRAFVRADAIDEQAAALMAESGCRECLLGIESGDPTVLANMRKMLDPEKARRAVELLDSHGIGTQCTFVVGFPGECSASIERTAALISSFPSGERARAIHRYYMFRFEVVPLCPAASPERRLEFGLSGVGENWAHKTMNSDEARDAMRRIFEKVSGATHMYLEHVPLDWPTAVARQIMEARDAVQKNLLKGLPGDDGAGLLAMVRAADQAASARQQGGK
jgi:p-methyltransferase